MSDNPVSKGEFDWDDEGAVPASTGGNYGDSEIIWFRVSAGAPERFAVLSPTVSALQTHAVKGQGYYECLGEEND